MGIMDVLNNMFGGAERAADAPVVETPPVSELLAPNKVMEKEWLRVAREDSVEFGDMTRSELGREFGARWFPAALPAAGEERRSAVEDRLVTRSRGLYADHLEQVQKVFDLPDEQVRSSIMTEIDVLPGRDRPLDRALQISGAILSEEAADRHMDIRGRELDEEFRMSPPSFEDWHEHKAGEPAILAAERDGDTEHVDRGRKAYVDSFQLKDPTLREIARTVVDKSDSWSDIGVDDLTSGQVRLDAATAERVRSSAATYEPGRRRDGALVEAYLDDYAARNPKVVDQWNRQALEVMSEGPAFMRSRYGTETDGMSVRQVVSLEAMRAVAGVRAAQDAQLVRDVSADRAHGRQPSGPSAQVRAASMSAMGRSIG